ncbi:hypothetical protein FSU_2009 [Fibrobacter succinogenes subsp. succinogenes S85]|uniref:Membrane protein n=2 Tax=Fibrobacter succinogenes TaxID=833 RepID=A7UG47_FIBSS|nr:membrane protein [Fibrobacter succinogenes subsp. succinogenes S85]ACX75124.1 hypothetical protein Fisuc_1527 [Fibrobacter succinogenes subsp. succinogenes S85]ADL25648.1 hypothetical protein FSU_2009 [Fibrobacter succinogenes subsp. succinogenes S85]
MNMKMKNILIALLTASVAASASAVADNQKALQAKADSANAKRGVEIGGSIRAVAQRSSFSTDQDVHSVNKMPNVEHNEYVSADLSFGFRPYENVRANVIMRLGGGMQEYFAAAAKTLEAKWLNVEGNIGKNFYWTVGDFRSAISPLSIYNPGIDILYEPTIFARKRHMAQKEQLLEGNKRNLQGINLQFRQEIDPMIGELRAEAFLARVNRVSVLDFTGAEGNILPGDEIAGTSLASATDKWLVGGNIELLPVQKNVYVGVTPMLIFDNENSKSYTYRHPNRDPQGFVPGDAENAYERQEINPYEYGPQNTFVLSARAGADVGGLVKQKGLSADVVAEYAMSVNKVKTAAYVNDLGLPVPETEESINGSALLATVNAGYEIENSWSAGLSLDVVMNDEKWFNNLAQSPSFFAQRVLNSDKDGNTVKYGVNSPLYSTFDALYNYSPKFTPVARTLGTDDNAFMDGQSKSYNIAPYNKNSWGSNVYSAAQLALINQMIDPAIQATLPNGLATANRKGFRVSLKGDWQNKIEAQALVNIFNQVTPESEAIDNVSYKEFGGGAKFDVAKMAGFSKALEFSGSFKRSENTVTPKVGTEAKVTSNFLNVGASFQFLPRLGITGGFQMIETDYGNSSLINPNVGLDVPFMTSNQTQWMVGFDYVVADNAWLAINFGMINVKNDYNTTVVGEEARNLPDYYSATDGAFGTYEHKFSQAIFEASINVEF